jgi:hypothetical protein
MVDAWGIAHAPHAQARALLIEHGFGETLFLCHTTEHSVGSVSNNDEGKWCLDIVSKLIPPLKGSHSGLLAFDKSFSSNVGSDSCIDVQMTSC